MSSIFFCFFFFFFFFILGLFRVRQAFLPWLTITEEALVLSLTKGISISVFTAFVAVLFISAASRRVSYTVPSFFIPFLSLSLYPFCFESTLFSPFFLLSFFAALYNATGFNVALFWCSFVIGLLVYSTNGAFYRKIEKRIYTWCFMEFLDDLLLYLLKL